MTQVTSIVIAGLGGQGVLKASDILANVAFRAGFVVKKSEIHGMSQRGGSVTSDVRFGSEVFSPMVPEGEADFLLAFAETEVAVNRAMCNLDTVIISPSAVDGSKLSHRKSLNMALLGVLSKYLPVDAQHWKAAIQSGLPENLHAANLAAFELGRASP